MTPHHTFATLVFATFASVLVGCGSEDPGGTGGTDDDLTSSSHAAMVQKCAATVATIKSLDVEGRIIEETKCIAKANDTTAKVFDEREGGLLPAHALTKFSAFRGDAKAACGAYVDAVNQNGLDPAFEKTKCAARVESMLASMIQTYGQLGGVPVNLNNGMWRDEPRACYTQFANDSSKLRDCIEADVPQVIKKVSSAASVARTSAAIRGGNAGVCKLLAKRSTEAESSIIENKCRIEAAIFLQQLEARTPH